MTFNFCSGSLLLQAEVIYAYKMAIYPFSAFVWQVHFDIWCCKSMTSAFSSDKICWIVVAITLKTLLLAF